MSLCFNKDVRVFSDGYSRLIWAFFQRSNCDSKKTRMLFSISKNDLKYIKDQGFLLDPNDFLLLDLILKNKTPSYKRCVHALYNRYRDVDLIAFRLDLPPDEIKRILAEDLDLEYSESYSINMMIEKLIMINQGY